MNTRLKIKARTFGRRQAFVMDRDFYVDQERGKWCVFGDDTGYCYEEYSSEAQAHKECERLQDAKIDNHVAYAMTRIIACKAGQ